MNLSELLIIFVNKVLITQTKDVLSYMSNSSYHIIHCGERQKADKFTKPGDNKAV